MVAFYLYVVKLMSKTIKRLYLLLRIVLQTNLSLSEKIEYIFDELHSLYISVYERMKREM